MWKFVYCFRNIYPFILTLICLILYLCNIQVFLAFPLFFMFNSSDTLFGITKVLLQQFHTLFLLIFYMIIILYIFSLLGFFYFPKIFKYESVNNDNELVYEEENICSSTISCILYFFNFGLTSEGSINMNLISYKNNTGNYLAEFFFTVFLYSIIHIIFFNLILASITNGFDKMRESIIEKDYNKKNICFICQKTRNDCNNNLEDFNEHIFKHNKWKYIIFICNIILKEEKKELSNEEYIIYQFIKKGSINWIPEYKQTKDIDFQEKYKIPSLAIDAIVLTKKETDKYPDILLIKNKKPYEPIIGKYAFPGGFVKYNEDPELTCLRKLKEDAGINIQDIEKDIELFTIRGDSNRDPRRHVITIVYVVNIKIELNQKEITNIKRVNFYNLETIFKTFQNKMSFDHYSIVEEFVRKKNKDLFK